MCTQATGCLSPGPPLAIVIGIAYKLLSTEMFDRMPCISLLGVGLLHSKVSMKLMVAHLAVSPVTKMDPIFFPVIVLFLDTYVGLGQFANWLLGLGLSEAFLVYVLGLFLLGSCVKYAATCVWELSSHFKVGIFQTIAAPLPATSSNGAGDSSGAGAGVEGDAGGAPAVSKKAN